MRFFRRKLHDPLPVPTKVIFHVQTDKQTLDITVHGYGSRTPQQIVECSKDHVLLNIYRSVQRNGLMFQRWWAEDSNGNIVESEDNYEPPGWYQRQQARRNRSDHHYDRATASRI
ncbi:MAG: hypothetical protein E6R06_21355 [Mycobacterium sp.]|nr:MAG: hypothetical protein E6R06_21355 [Mycobacterium sp.]